MQTTSVGGSNSPKPHKLDTFLRYVLDNGLTGPICLVFGLSLVSEGIDDGRLGRLTMEAAGVAQHGEIEAVAVRLQDPAFIDHLVIALPSALIGILICIFSVDLIYATRSGSGGRRFVRRPKKRISAWAVFGLIAMFLAFAIELVPRLHFKQDGIQVVSGGWWGPPTLLVLVIATHTLSTYLVERGNRSDDELEDLV